MKRMLQHFPQRWGTCGEISIRPANRIMNGWLHEWMIDYMMIEWLDEWMDDCMMNGWLHDEWMIAWMNGWLHEWMNQSNNLILTLYVEKIDTCGVHFVHVGIRWTIVDEGKGVVPHSVCSFVRSSLALAKLMIEVVFVLAHVNALAVGESWNMCAYSFERWSATFNGMLCCTMNSQCTNSALLAFSSRVSYREKRVP